MVVGETIPETLSVVTMFVTLVTVSRVISRLGTEEFLSSAHLPGTGEDAI